MKKAFGLMAAFALIMSVSTAATAEEKWGKITSVDPATKTFTLADGTQLTVSDQQMGKFEPGQDVRASYEIKDGKKVVTDMAADRINELQTTD
jgi:hypothetical protein